MCEQGNARKFTLQVLEKKPGLNLTVKCLHIFQNKIGQNDKTEHFRNSSNPTQKKTHKSLPKTNFN